MPKMQWLKPLSCALAIALVTTTTPADAQTNFYRITCQATASLSQGGSLTYQLAGSLPETTRTEIPQNPMGTSMTLTVQWRDQNGRVQTLLNGSLLQDYEQLAPDADYAQLPFEGTFRGQPNSGDRLYATTASVHGLYVSLRPTSGQPQQMQVVHYLRSSQYVRSTVGTCQTGHLGAVIDERLEPLQASLQNVIPRQPLLLEPFDLLHQKREFSTIGRQISSSRWWN